MPTQTQFASPKSDPPLSRIGTHLRAFINVPGDRPRNQKTLRSPNWLRFWAIQPKSESPAATTRRTARVYPKVLCPNAV